MELTSEPRRLEARWLGVRMSNWNMQGAKQDAKDRTVKRLKEVGDELVKGE